MLTPLAFDLDSPSWLRNLRWASVLGMAGSVAGAHLLGLVFPSGFLFSLLGAFALWNLSLPILENRVYASAKGFIFLQISADIVFLTTVLWYSGGLVNPFSGFLLLYVIIAGLLLNAALTLISTGIAVLCVLVLIRAPTISLNGQEISLFSSPIWFGVPIGLILLILFTNAFTLIFVKRLGLAQQELRQRTKMDALGRLVAGLAHEIGTPLNSILLLARELETTVPAEGLGDVRTIANQANRCGEIVSLLLGYSQTLVRKNEDVKYSEVHLVPWMQETYDLIVQTEKQRFPDLENRSQVQFTIDASSLPEVIAVPTLILRQVVENLLKNARDALISTVDPKISVEVFLDEIENELVFLVSDNGPGFTREQAEKAFEAFFSTKKQGFGSGLGLYISYYLLAQVGGRIAIEGASGGGASMRVTLPSLVK